MLYHWHYLAVVVIFIELLRSGKGFTVNKPVASKTNIAWHGSVVRAATASEATAQETLTFTSDFSLTSDPLVGESKENLSSFFKDDKCRIVIMSAGGTREVNLIPTTPEILDFWNTAAEEYGSAPEDGDTALSVDTTVGFPGLKVVSTICIGVKLVQDDTGTPMYEFMTIAEKSRTEGSPPVVWLYNQLTGAAKREKDKLHAPDAKSVTRVSIVNLDSGELGICFDVKFRIEVVFPRFLVRILPTSKEKMEERGSSAISKAVVKDVENGVKGTRDAYLSHRRQTAVTV